MFSPRNWGRSPGTRGKPGWAWVLVWLVSGCASSRQEPIPIGAVFSMTGPLAEIGEAQLDAIALAAEQINDAGGIQGMPLQILFRDAAGDVDRAARMAISIREDISPVIIGGIESSVTRKLTDTLGPAVLTVSPSATSSVLGENGQILVSLAPPVSSMATVLASRALSGSITRMSILYTIDRLGDGLPIAFHAAFTAAGGTILDRKELTPGRLNYLNSLTSIMASKPQAILLDTCPVDGSQIIKDYLDGFIRKEVLWMFSDRLALPSFVDLVGGGKFTFQHEGISPSPAWDETYDAFERSFVDRFGRRPAPGAYPAQAYDAVFLIALGLAQSATTGPTLMESMRAAAAGGTTYTAETFREALQAVSRGEEVNFEGASGSLDPDATGRVAGRYDVWRVEGGEMDIIEKGVVP